MEWILLVLFYGLAKGGRELVKKKALEKSTVIEVLFFYTLLSFLFVTPEAFHLTGISWQMIAAIALKSFLIFCAWMCGFMALDHMPVSVYGILDLARVLFAMVLGVLVLKERMSVYQTIGMLLVIAGLLLLKKRPEKKGQEGKAAKGTDIAEELSFRKGEKKHRVAYFVLLAMISCFLNAVSGIMDKVLMRDLDSGTLQFWYMLFLVFFYGLYVLVTRTKLHLKPLVKNYWIWILSFLFVLADRALFIANGNPDSKVTIMTLIKQSSCLVVILGGKLVFHEKNIGYKLFCAGIVIGGIMLSLL